MNSLNPQQFGDGLSIHCIVMPQSVVSLYDHKVEHAPSIEDVAGFLKARCLRSLEGDPLAMNTTDLKEIKKSILDTQVDFTKNECTKHVIILVDRRSHSKKMRKKSQRQFVSIYIFRDSVFIQLAELRRNHLLEIQYEAFQLESDETSIIRSYLHFGNNQCIRFWPEQLVWFIPRLFLIDQDEAHVHLKRIYSDEYRHGFRLKLDDPVFDKYYKILTRWDHVSVNYYRPRQFYEKGMDWGFRDYLERNTIYSDILKKFIRFWTKNGYDSDAIFEDAALSDSNLATICNEHAMQYLCEMIDRYRGWRKTQCTKDDVLHLSECPFMIEIIENLRIFRDGNYDVDASNVVYLDYYSTTRALGHLIDAHGLLSKANGPRVRSYIRQHVGCKEGNQCQLFQDHCSRRRMRYDRDRVDQTDEQYEDQLDDVRSLCAVTWDSLSIAHCNLLHSEEDCEAVIKMLKSESGKFDGSQYVDEEEQAEDDEDDFLAIDWG